jgi:hypothetical protein
MGTSDDLRRRFAEAGKVLELFGTGDPNDIREQSKLVANVHRQFWDGGFERGNLSVQLLVDAVLFLDNLGVTRSEIIEAVRNIRAPEGLQLEMGAPGSGIVSGR